MESNRKSEITKNTLAASLKKILLKKTLEKISIREIVEECGLNRQTFYYHFKDIYDLLEWILKKEAIDIFDNLEGEEIWQEGLLKLLKYIDNNRTIFTNVVKRCLSSKLSHFLIKNYTSSFPICH